MKDEKYIVFKREDFDELLKYLPSDIHEGVIPNVEDAIVIRKQDIFAGPALHAYASSISTSLEIMDLQGDSRQHIPQRLFEVRDYFFQQALEADDVRTKKVPD